MDLEKLDIPDKAIVKAFVSNDQKVFELVFKNYYGAMYAVASSILGPHKADEAVQEAWINIINHIESFQYKSTLKTWMISIVANQAKQSLRKEKRYVNLEDDDFRDSLMDRFAEDGHWQKPLQDWEQDTPESQLLNEELSDCIAKNWENLPENYKSIMRLREYEGLSLDSICNILDLSSSNVRVILHRAKNKLLAVVDHYRRTGQC